MWQAAASIAALVTALSAAAIGVAGFIRSARAEDARGRADAAGVGLEYLERALATQQGEITRQEGLIGELRGQLTDCRTERESMADTIRSQADRIEMLEERMP